MPGAALVGPEALQLARSEIIKVLEGSQLVDPFTAYDITGRGNGEPTP
jgi:hypothetical protein